MKADLISRQAAINALGNAGLINYAATGSSNGLIHAMNVIKALPAAPPTQTNTESTLKCVESTQDCVSRQAALDVLARTAREKFNLSDEFNHYLAGLMDGDTAIRQLPSAQPELIRCGECANYDGRRCSRTGWTCGTDDFCSFAEKRRTKNE